MLRLILGTVKEFRTANSNFRLGTSSGRNSHHVRRRDMFGLRLSRRLQMFFWGADGGSVELTVQPLRTRQQFPAFWQCRHARDFRGDGINADATKSPVLCRISVRYHDWLLRGSRWANNIIWPRMQLRGFEVLDFRCFGRRLLTQLQED